MVQICSNLARSTGGPYASALSLHFAAFESNRKAKVIASTNDDLSDFSDYNSYSNLSIFQSSRNFTYSIPTREILQIWRSLRDEDNWIHLHGLFTATSAITGILSLILGKQISLQTHGIFDNYDRSRGRLKKEIISKTLLYPLRKKVVLVVTSSESEAEQVPRNYFPNARKISIKYGVPDQRLYQVQDESVIKKITEIESLSGPKVLYFSRITKKKNLPFLARAVEEASVQVKDLILVVVGPADTEGLLDLETSRSILQSRMHYLGPIYSSDAKHRIFNMSRLFALPSASENFSLATLEAIESGLPCIISPNVGLAEWFDRESTPIHVVDLSLTEWAQKIVALAKLGEPGQRNLPNFNENDWVMNFEYIIMNLNRILDN